MDYEKKYNEALERAKQLSKELTVDDIVEQIFPELKESEDERIRKWIIDDIRYNMNNEPFDNSKYRKKAEKAIAWLEKQGEQKSAWSKEDEVILQWVVSDIKRLEKDNKKSRVISIRELAWFNSLKDRVQPQNTWKPSDEQIKALEEVVNSHWNPDGGTLWHLYEELKKL